MSDVDVEAQISPERPETFADVVEMDDEHFDNWVQWCQDRGSDQPALMEIVDKAEKVREKQGKKSKRTAAKEAEAEAESEPEKTGK